MNEQVDAIRRFNRFYTNFLGLLNETLLDSPLTLTEGRILFEIDNLAACRAKELIEILNLDRGYMSRVLKRMERLELIERVTDTRDKRVRTIKLKKDGRHVLNSIDRDANRHIGSVLKLLNGSNRRILIKAMQDIEIILSDRAVKSKMGCPVQS